MGDSVERFIDKLKEHLGDEASVKVALPDEVAGLAADTTALVLTMAAGDVRQAREAAGAANAAVMVNPQIQLILAIANCDFDTRQIDEIPAARKSLRVLYASLSDAAFARFAVVEQAILLVAVGKGQRVGMQLQVPSEFFRS